MRSTSPVRLAPVLAAAATVLVGALALSGCSAREPEPETETSGRTPSAPSSALASAKWGECMRAAGFDVQDPSAEEFAAGAVKAPAATDAAAFRDASRTCGGRASTSDAEKSAYARQIRGFVACMAEKGVTGFDVTQVDDGGLGWDTVDVETPAYRAAFPTCQKKYLDGWSGL